MAHSEPGGSVLSPDFGEPSAGRSELSAAPPFQPSSHVWYKDGNIILAAENEGFRVFSGILAEQSVVFSEMLQMPQPEHNVAQSGSDTYDGSPVVWLSDSSAELRPFLKATHDARYNVDEKLECAVLCHILHLSSKYIVPHIRRRAIRALQYSFPPTLDRLSSLESTASRSGMGTVSDLFHLANIASEARAFSLLASILILCATQRLEFVLDGSTFSSRLVQLTQANRRAVFQARQQLSHLARSVTLNSLYYTQQCTLLRCLITKRVEGAKLLEGSKPDGLLSPLSQFKHLSNILLCNACQTELNHDIAVGRQEVWERVPSLLGLGQSWEDLARMDDVEDADDD